MMCGYDRIYSERDRIVEKEKNSGVLVDVIILLSIDYSQNLKQIIDMYNNFNAFQVDANAFISKQSQIQIFCSLLGICDNFQS